MTRSLILAFLIIFAATTAFAEYYEYTDNHGIKHFTDDLSEIPENLRKKIKIYKSIRTYQKKTTPPSSPRDTSEDLATQHKDLTAQKEQLDEEYNRLITNKEILIGKKKELSIEEFFIQASGLNQDIKSYNTRIEDYEKKIIQHNKKVVSTQNERLKKEIRPEDTPPNK